MVAAESYTVPSASSATSAADAMLHLSSPLAPLEPPPPSLPPSPPSIVLPEDTTNPDKVPPQREAARTAASMAMKWIANERKRCREHDQMMTAADHAVQSASHAMNISQWALAVIKREIEAAGQPLDSQPTFAP